MSLKDIFNAIQEFASSIWTADLTPLLGWFGFILFIIFTFVSLFLSLCGYSALKMICDFCFRKISYLVHSKKYNKNIDIIFRFLLKPIFILIPFLFSAALHFIVFPNLFFNMQLNELKTFNFYLICSSIMLLIWYVYSKYYFKR